MFVAAAALLVDGLLLVVWLSAEGTPDAELARTWGLVKAGAVLTVVGVLAVKLRSAGLGVAVILLAGFFLEASEAIEPRIGPLLAGVADMGPLRRLVPAPAQVWGSSIVLAGLTILIEVVLTTTGLRHSPLLRRVSLLLAAFVVLLFAFVGVWNLVASAFDSVALATVGMFGPLVVLSLMLALTAGVLAVAVRWSKPE